MQTGYANNPLMAYHERLVLYGRIYLSLHHGGEKSDIYNEQYPCGPIAPSRPAGIRVHRQIQCRKVIAHQRAHGQPPIGQDLANPGQNSAYQSFFDQRRVVSGGFAGVRLCEDR